MSPRAGLSVPMMWQQVSTLPVGVLLTFAVPEGLMIVQALCLWQGLLTCTALQHLSCRSAQESSAADAAVASRLLAVTVPASQPVGDQHLGELCTQAGIPSSLLNAYTRLHPSRHLACHSLQAGMPCWTGSLAACFPVHTCIPPHLACSALQSNQSPPNRCKHGALSPIPARLGGAATVQGPPPCARHRSWAQCLRSAGQQACTGPRAGTGSRACPCTCSSQASLGGTAGVKALPPENDEGSVEYKLRLKEPDSSPVRFQQLVSWQVLAAWPARSCCQGVLPGTGQ